MTNPIIFSETFKTFLDKKRENSRVCNSLYHYANNPKLPSYGLMINPNEVNYITFRNDGMISFLPKGKQHLTNDSGTWKKENRQSGKPAKVVRKLFTDKAVKRFKESDFEIFNAIYKAHFNTELIFTLLPNVEIGNVYGMSRKQGGGTLNGSCMNDDVSYMRIYEKCESLQILILKDKDNLLCGRALVWTIGEKIFMDRIYYSDDYMLEMFFTYAIENGMIRKKFQSYTDKCAWIDSNGVQFDEVCKVYTNTDFTEYPYIDTFSYGEDGFLTNESGFTFTYDNTNGNRDGENRTDDDDDNDDYDDNDDNDRIYDEISDEYIDEEDAVCIDRGRYRGCYTNVSNTVETENGYIYWINSNDIVTLANGDVAEYDNATCCEYSQEYHLSNDCQLVVNGEYSDKYIHEDYVITDLNGETWYINDDDVTLVNGEYYPIDSELIVEVNGTYILVETCLELA